MSSILNVKQTTIDYISGNGNNTFELSYAPIAIIEVKVNQILLDRSTYRLINEKSINFDKAPEAGTNNVSVKYVFYSELPLIRGKEGKSAYQTAKENGYNKTEIDFNTTLGSLDNIVTKDHTIQASVVPSSTTAGFAGQQYIVNNENLYICLGNTPSGYVWKKIV